MVLTSSAGRSSRRAIRMNILCNPTGKKNQFRAIDWWVEHNNLYIKASKCTGCRWRMKYSPYCILDRGYMAARSRTEPNGAS